MADKIQLEIDVKGSDQAIKSVTDLRKAIKAAKDEQLAASAAFGESSKEFANASKKVAELKDKMEDLNDSTQSLKGTGVEGLTSSFKLFTDGISNFDFDKLKTAFKGIGSAMSAIPILLIVQGITLLAEKFEIFTKIADLLTDALFAVTDALGFTNKAAEEQSKSMIENMEKQKKAVEDRYNAEIKLAKAAGEDTAELENEKLVKLEETTAKQILSLENLKAKKGELNQDEQENYEELQSKLLQLSTDRIAKEIAAEKDRVNKLFESGANLLAYADSIGKELERAGMSQREREIADVKDKTAQQLKELDKLKGGIQDEQTYLAAKETRTKIQEAEQKEINAINARYSKERVENDLADFKELVRLRMEWNTAMEAAQKLERDRIAAEEKAAKLAEIQEINQANLDSQQLQHDNYVSNLNIRRELDDQRRQEFEQNEQATAQFSTDLALATTQSLQNLSDVYFLYKNKNLQKGSKAEEDAARKQFQINKALAITSAVISGINGVINALSAQSVIPEPYGTILKVVNAVAIGVAAATNIAKIASTQFNPGTASASGGGAATPPPIPAPPTINSPGANTNTGTTFDETGQASGGSVFKTVQPTVNVKAEVVETEVTKKQNNVKQIENQATF